MLLRNMKAGRMNDLVDIGELCGYLRQFMWAISRVKLRFAFLSNNYGFCSKLFDKYQQPFSLIVKSLCHSMLMKTFITFTGIVCIIIYKSQLFNIINFYFTGRASISQQYHNSKRSHIGWFILYYKKAFTLDVFLQIGLQMIIEFYLKFIVGTWFWFGLSTVKQ